MNTFSTSTLTTCMYGETHGLSLWTKNMKGNIMIKIQEQNTSCAGYHNVSFDIFHYIRPARVKTFIFVP